MTTVTDAHDEKKMPLLDHLIELRQRMLWSVASLLVVFLVCFFFAEQIFDFLASFDPRPSLWWGFVLSAAEGFERDSLSHCRVLGSKGLRPEHCRVQSLVPKP